MKVTQIQVLGDAGKTYVIDLAGDGAPRCSCPAYFFQSKANPAYSCKHMEFVVAGMRVAATV